MIVAVRILITLAAAVVVVTAEYYIIPASGVAIGSWKYCLIIGFGSAIVLAVWRMTKPGGTSEISN